jgi:hypothetical protein
MRPIPIHVAVEDELSETMVRRLLLDTGRDYSIGVVFRRGGFGYLRKRANNWNAAAAAGTPILLLTDLDQHFCVSDLIKSWLDNTPHPNLIFRIAVREVESWLLADRACFAGFLGIHERLMPFEPDAIPDPKRSLVGLARKSRIRTLREAIVPRSGSTAVQGPDYNDPLCEFVRAQWNPDAAATQSPSLSRAKAKLLAFEPTWHSIER